MVDSMLVAISQTVAIRKRLLRRLVLSAQAAIKDKSLSAKPNAIVSSMVAIAIQNVNLLRGTNQLDGIVQNVVTSLWRRKSVVEASRSYVVMATTKKRKLNNTKSPENEFQALFSLNLTNFLILWETSIRLFY